jgi:hypothetical protein
LPVLVCALVLALLAAACDDDHHDDVGDPVGATCPPISGLSYENFARPFMESYCTRCHSDALQGGAIATARLPAHDFDTLDAVMFWVDHVEGMAAAGPDRVNTDMPPSAPFPTEEERYQLGEWLACERERHH